MSVSCICCNKPLSVPLSQVRGMGPICAAKKAAEFNEDGSNDRVDLPFDPAAKDIVCERREDGLHFNIYQVFKHHSPTGFEWGYGGSGPADFALNILELFCRERGEKPTVKLWDGNKVSQLAWSLHQPFKSAYVADLEREGGTISGNEIRAWISEMAEAEKLRFAA